MSSAFIVSLLINPTQQKMFDMKDWFIFDEDMYDITSTYDESKLEEITERLKATSAISKNLKMQIIFDLFSLAIAHCASKKMKINVAVILVDAIKQELNHLLSFEGIVSSESEPGDAFSTSEDEKQLALNRFLELVSH